MRRTEAASTGRSIPWGFFSVCRDLLTQANMQFAQLRFVHGAGGVGEQTLCPLGYREGDDIANRFGTRCQRDNAIQAEGQATMRGRAIPQGVEQEAELETRLFFGDAECAEHLFLAVSAVNTHRASDDLPTIRRNVVGFRETGARVAFERVDMFVFVTGKRVMTRAPVFGVFVILEHREVDDPFRAPRFAGDVPFFM